MPQKKSVRKGKKMATIRQGARLTLLIILDGFGLADPKNKGNAITPRTAPSIFRYMKRYPSTQLKASGKAVGLFAKQQGNSEAGHLNIGAGRVVKQDLLTITDAIRSGIFFKNEAFKQAIHHAKKYNTNIHLFALLTHRHSVHTSPEHVYAMLELFRKNKCKNVYLHLFTDGRDSSPHGAPTFLHQLRTRMKHEQIATVMGRFYAMDRNKIWERTEKAYRAMVHGQGCEAVSAEEAIEQAYNREETDEYICPTVIQSDGKPVATIGDNDVIFFANARSDRARQITKAFVQPDFQKKNPGTFKRTKHPKNIRFVAMTDFGPDLPGIFTAFPSPDVENSLAKAIGEQYRQLYISETEKYAHVTYFINGGYAAPINGEQRILVPSPKERSYANEPQMHARQMTDTILQYIDNDVYNFIAINYPNADMVGHTGNIPAAKKAVGVVDKQVKRLVTQVLKKNGQVLITADHGNAEQMINLETGEMMTEHSINSVPCILIRKDAKGMTLKKNGKLADIAPTLLKMMGIKKPSVMTGKSLL